MGGSPDISARENGPWSDQVVQSAGGTFALPGRTEGRWTVSYEDDEHVSAEHLVRDGRTTVSADRRGRLRFRVNDVDGRRLAQVLVNGEDEKAEEGLFILPHSVGTYSWLALRWGSQSGQRHPPEVR